MTQLQIVGKWSWSVVAEIYGGWAKGEREGGQGAARAKIPPGNLQCNASVAF